MLYYYDDFLIPKKNTMKKLLPADCFSFCNAIGKHYASHIMAVK